MNMYTYIYTCIFMYIFLLMYIYLCILVNLCISMYIHTLSHQQLSKKFQTDFSPRWIALDHKCIYLYIYIYIYTSIHICIYVCVFMYIYVCIFTYSHPQLSKIFETEFFPRWINILFQWLTAKPDYEEVTRWCVYLCVCVCIGAMVCVGVGVCEIGRTTAKSD